MDASINNTPWDTKVFGIDTYEIVDPSTRTLSKTVDIPGHFTVKVDPLASKQELHNYGFYYCDTLLKLVCLKEHFHSYDDERVSISEYTPLEELLKVSDGVFRHGRFHRDFNLDPGLADERYNRWLTQIYNEGHIWGFLFDGELAGFLACNGNHISLIALEKGFHGRGLAKYFWTPACRALFYRGYKELSTSISACNLAMFNLVSSLGFKPREAVDVYHKFNPDKS